MKKNIIVKLITMSISLIVTKVNNKKYYIIIILRILISINKVFIKVLLNIRVKINIIILNLIKIVNLLIYLILNISLVFYNRKNKRFSDIYKNIKIDINSISLLHQIFIIK